MQEKIKSTFVLNVLIFSTGGRIFDYLANEPLQQGDMVQVSFGRRQVVALVMGLVDESHLSAEKLKTITQALEAPFKLTAGQIYLAQWMTKYYHDSLACYCAMMLPKWIKLGKTTPFIAPFDYAVEFGVKHKYSLQQKMLVDWLKENELKHINHEMLLAQGFGQRTIKSLVNAGTLVLDHQTQTMPYTLSEPQEKAVDAVLNTPGCTLLHGVTASGKTYVYIDLIKRKLASGGQVLILVPEIGLTPQTTEKIRRHVTATLCYWHSQLAEGQKSGIWEAVYNQTIHVVVGTRSALFLPFQNLQLIIVDEEHDQSFYQQNRPFFSVRDLAVVLGKQQNIPVVLSSATPSLESFHNVNKGRYQYVQMDKAFSGHVLQWHVVDARRQHLVKGIEPSIVAHVEQVLAQKQQVLFFLNRRGYAPLTLCHGCGWIYQCDHCDVKLTYSKEKGRHRCHLCDATFEDVAVCQSCKMDGLIKVGQGTERLAETLAMLFPSASILRVDADTTATPAQWANVRQCILNHEVDLIVGTQMMAKGHDFPMLSSVVVLDVDHALHATDFRAIERWGQRLRQVAGRCGRQQKNGYVWVQTHNPGHPALSHLQSEDYHVFADYLLQMRAEAAWPPNSFLAKVKLIETSDERLTRGLAKLMAHPLPNIEMIGPIYPGIKKRQNHHHGYVLLRSCSRESLARACRHFTQQQYRVEVDPQDLEA